MSRRVVLLFLISAPAVLVSLPTRQQNPAMLVTFHIPEMLVSLPTLRQDLGQKKSSSKLVMMYDRYQHQQNQHQKAVTVEMVRSKKLTRSVTPRRHPPLNPDPSLLSVEARKGRPTSPKPTKSHSSTHQKQQQKGLRAQLMSEVHLQFERQHAFEVSLEQMLMEVEDGADWTEEEEKKQKKVGKDTKKKEEQPNPRWQKIWYKRLG